MSIYHFSVLHEDGGMERLNYNALTTRFVDDAGMNIPVSYTETFSERKQALVRLSLGTACNFQCSYCIQSPFDKKRFFRDGAFTESYARDFVSRMKATMQNALPDLTERHVSFSLWGGEPLYYFEELRILVPLLREAFPGCWFGMGTNGSLLGRDDIAGWLKEEGIQFFLSHDGPGQIPCRGQEILDDKRICKHLLSFMEERSGTPLEIAFCPVMTKQNPSYRGWVMYFHDRYPELAPYLRVGEHPYMRLPDMGRMGLTCTPGQMEANRLDLIREIDGLGDGILAPFVPKYRGWAVDMLKSMARGKMYSPCYSYLPQNFVFDLAGNAWTCHNVISGRHDENWLGNIFEQENLLPSPLHKGKRPYAFCKGCLLEGLCAGGCPVSQVEVFHKCTCKWNEHLPLFHALIRLMNDNRARLVGVDR